MAKPSTKKSDSNVTRIKASESSSASKKATAAKPAKSTQKDVVTSKAEKVISKPKSDRKNIFVRAGAYFKGAWTEVRLVRWPDRKSTWGMTGALILFTLFFVIVILLLDYAFSLLFKLILGS